MSTSLLREIQSDATDSGASLEALLRKCLVLASRLKHEKLREWVNHELNGYRDGAELPDYRITHGLCMGHFSGAFGSGLKNAPIPAQNIPEEFREFLTTVKMHEGIAGIEQLIRDHTSSNLHFAWPAEASSMFGHQIYERMVLMQGWKSVPKSFLAGILSTVRNRVLNFVLEIETENPNAGEAPVGSTPIPSEKVSQIFNTNIYGNVGNVASGEHINQTASLTVIRGDLPSLLTAIRSEGVAQSDVSDLEKAVKQDLKPQEGTFGPEVGGWIGRMATKAACGTLKVASNLGVGVLTAYLKHYYGW